MSEEDEEEIYKKKDSKNNKETEIYVYKEWDNDNDNDRSGQRSENEDKNSKDQLNNINLVVNKLLEFIFQLNIIFNTKKFINNQPNLSLLIYFSDIFNLLFNIRNFFFARKYILYFSIFIYI